MDRIPGDVSPGLPDKRPALASDDPMAEAGRRVIAYHFKRLLDNEPAARVGDDPEAVHAMRVAMRRMRSALRVFGDYYRRKTRRDLIEGLRETGRALGPVRDVDVLLAHLDAYCAALESGDPDLDVRTAALRAERERRRAAMLAFLDGEGYAAFVQGLAAFCQMPGSGDVSESGDGDPRPLTIREAAPAIIYRRYGRILAYERIIEAATPADLHALRIQAKRLRYTLEFFRDALGPDVRDLIAAAVALQDHLGMLQDAITAQAIIVEVGGPALPPGVQTYLAVRQSEAGRVQQSARKVWGRLVAPAMRRKLARAIGAL